MLKKILIMMGWVKPSPSEFFVMTGIRSASDGYLISGFQSEEEALAFIKFHKGDDNWSVETKESYEWLVLTTWKDGRTWQPHFSTREKFDSDDLQI